jgi:hypothetical protein
MMKPIYKTTLKFLDENEREAIVRPSTGGGDAASEEGCFVLRDVPIYDARPIPTSLDKEGFELREHVSKVEDFYDDAAIETRYENELRAWMLETTAARRVEVFDHTRRSTSPEIRQQRGNREQAATIHNDYDDVSGIIRLRDLYPEEADALLKNRFAIINVWRSIAGTIKNYPLAMCDASSVNSTELVSVPRISESRVGAIQLAIHNQEQRWFIFPEMEMNEVLLFKVFDSATDGRARFTIHTSFDDPTAATDAPPRQSIESRCFVFF